MVTPPHLNKGDKIGLVAAGKKAPVEVVERAMETIRQYGYEPVQGKSSTLSHFQFAGTDDQRVDDLQAMLDDPTVRAILFIRGGYGLSRIIDRLRHERFVRSPKWLAGFSDLTLIHAWASKLGFESLHSAMPVNFEMKGANDSFNRLFEILAGEIPAYSISTHPLSKPGTASGRLAGGNLSMLQAMAGAPFDFDFHDTILFIEDTDEYLYHIDRMMQWLRLRGALGQIRGLIVGHFDHTKDNPEPFGQSVEEIILEACRDFTFPIVFGFPAGHIMPNYPLIIGRQVNISVESGSTNITF